jgi:hypothetical protein
VLLRPLQVAISESVSIYTKTQTQYILADKHTLKRTLSYYYLPHKQNHPTCLLHELTINLPPVAPCSALADVPQPVLTITPQPEPPPLPLPESLAEACLAAVLLGDVPMVPVLPLSTITSADLL